MLATLTCVQLYLEIAFGVSISYLHKTCFKLQAFLRANFARGHVSVSTHNRQQLSHRISDSIF